MISRHWHQARAQQHGRASVLLRTGVPLDFATASGRGGLVVGRGRKGKDFGYFERSHRIGSTAAVDEQGLADVAVMRGVFHVVGKGRRLRQATSRNGGLARLMLSRSGGRFVPL